MKDGRNRAVTTEKAKQPSAAAESQQPRQRPASLRAHEKVLDAALELFAEKGFDATSMDSIAGASGVSKATIYKHWPDKDRLCLEVLSCLHDEAPELKSGDPRKDLITLLSHAPSGRSKDLQGRLMPHLQAYAAKNRAFGNAWRATLMEPPRRRITEILERAIAQGELNKNLDLNLSLALLLGPMIYRHVMGAVVPTLPEDMPAKVVDSFWRTHAVEKPTIPEKAKRES